MASITLRNLDDEVKVRLCARAAGHARSMEEEAHIVPDLGHTGIEVVGPWKAA